MAQLLAHAGIHFSLAGVAGTALFIRPKGIHSKVSRASAASAAFLFLSHSFLAKAHPVMISPEEMGGDFVKICGKFRPACARGAACLSWCRCPCAGSTDNRCARQRHTRELVAPSGLVARKTESPTINFPERDGARSRGAGECSRRGLCYSLG